MDKSTSSATEDISLYNSALDGSTFFLIGDNDNSNLNTSKNVYDKKNQEQQPQQDTYYDVEILQKNQNVLNKNDLHQSDSFDNLEVDPKSNLANKTIFKTDNPNLSIIEINSNDNSLKCEEESVYLIGSDDDEEHKEKVRSILHSSKQKLNVINATTTSGGSSNSSSSSNSNSTSNSTSTSSSSNSNSSTSALSISAATATAAVSTATTTTLNENMKPLSEKRVINIYNTIEEFERNLPKTVKILTTPYGSRVYVVGTAHFSEESQDDVSFIIRNVKPDVVMVELCTSRIHILKYDEKSLLEEAKSINFTKIRNIIKMNGFLNGIFYILLLHMSAQLAKEIGMAPGGEFRRAFDEVQKLSRTDVRCTLHLGDRPLNITIQRALSALSLWQTIKLVWRLSLTSTESFNIEEIEECKQQDLLEKLLQEMAGEFPAFSDVLVKERDLYLCHSLQVAATPIIQKNGLQRPVKVVGVVGIGHTAGIMKNWLKVDQDKIKEMLEIPPSSLSTRILQYTFKIGFYGLITYSVIKFLRPKLNKFIVQ